MEYDVIVDQSIISDFFDSNMFNDEDASYHFITSKPEKLSCIDQFEYFDKIKIHVFSSHLLFYQQIAETLPRLNNPLFVSSCKNLNGLIRNLCKIDTVFFEKKKLLTGINDCKINSFCFENNLPYFIDSVGEKSRFIPKIRPWKVKPDSIYQDMFVYLMTRDNMPLVSCLSSAGRGKTFLALACALDQVITQRKFREVVVIKSTHEVGMPLGYLPGDVNSKISNYFDYAVDLIDKLCLIKRPPTSELDVWSYINFKPINYLRGSTIDDSFVIIDEAQNLKEYELRTILSRLGNNVKAIVLGDNNQIDSKITAESNGFSALIRKMVGEKEYAHITLKGKCSRGPICDMVQRVGL